MKMDGRAGEAQTIRLSKVEPEKVSWLFPSRIPFGKVTVVDGDPGLGKSSVMYDIAARLSRGDPMPDGSRPDLDGPWGTVILSAEDGLADTIRPRLDAAGADCERIVALTQIKTEGCLRFPTVRDDAAILQAINDVTALLVIVDPLMAYLGADVNSHRDQDIRSGLAPLVRLAELMGVAVVVIRHLNKTNGTNPLYRGGGSIGIIGAARAGLLVAPDPDDEKRRILAVSKSNLAEKAPSLAFRLNTDEQDRLRVVWQGESNVTARQLLAVPDGEERNALDEAVEFLRQELADGATPSREVQKAADGAGISRATLRRARERLGVKPEREGFGASGRWLWRLPDIDAQGAWAPMENPEMSTYEKSQSPCGDSGNGHPIDAQTQTMGIYEENEENDEDATAAWVPPGATEDAAAVWREFDLEPLED